MTHAQGGPRGAFYQQEEIRCGIRGQILCFERYYSAASPQWLSWRLWRVFHPPKPMMARKCITPTTSGMPWSTEHIPSGNGGFTVSFIPTGQRMNRQKDSVSKVSMLGWFTVKEPYFYNLRVPSLAAYCDRAVVLALNRKRWNCLNFPSFLSANLPIQAKRLALVSRTR